MRIERVICERCGTEHKDGTGSSITVSISNGASTGTFTTTVMVGDLCAFCREVEYNRLMEYKAAEAKRLHG